jgi:uncharacterized Fe-S cluster-containing radical SAM superfamily protein
LGCNFCWSDRAAKTAEAEYYSPKEIVNRLMGMHQAISQQDPANRILIALGAGEPTIGRAHLIDVVREAKRFASVGIDFEVETNGILLGADPSFVKEIKCCAPASMYIRICLKGATEAGFEQRTGVEGRFVEFQYKAIEHLKDAGVSTSIAVMSDPFLMKTIERGDLLRRLYELQCLENYTYYNLRSKSDAEWEDQLVSGGSKGVYTLPGQDWKNWPQAGTWPAIEFESVYPYKGVAKMLGGMGQQDFISVLKGRYPFKVFDINKEIASNHPL